MAEAAQYSGLSVRTLNRYTVAAKNPLPHFKIGGRILIRKMDLDRWIELVGRKDHDPGDRTLQERAEADVDRTYESGDDQFGVVGGRRDGHTKF